MTGIKTNRPIARQPVVTERPQLQKSDAARQTGKAQQVETGYEQKVDNKLTEGVQETPRSKHERAIDLANQVFASSAVGPLVDDGIKGKSKEQALDYCHDLAQTFLNNRRLDPGTKRAVMKKIAERFGEHYAPDDSSKSKFAADWFYDRFTPDGVKDAKLNLQVTGMTPKEVGEQQLKQIFWAVGISDSPM